MQRGRGVVGVIVGMVVMEEMMRETGMRGRRSSGTRGD